MAELKKKHRYKASQGKRLIEVRIKDVQQLFDARDPAPFRDRDLDDDFVEYVVSSAKEFSLITPLKILIYIEELESKELQKESIVEAIQSYLSYQIDLQRGNLKTYINRAQIFLIIGIVTLISCLAIAQNIHVPEPPGAMGILREGIIIFGWVSIWKPIELVLFDWYPIYEKVKFYKKLLDTEIEIVFGHSMKSK